LLGCGQRLRYVERWLKAPLQTADGQLQEREKGTPQGGVVTPPTMVQNMLSIGAG